MLHRLPEFTPTARARAITMPLHPGIRLGPYEITAQIGVGGMGEVFRMVVQDLFEELRRIVRMEE